MVVDKEVNVTFRVERVTDAMVHVLSGQSIENLTETRQVYEGEQSLSLKPHFLHIVIVQASTQKNSYPFAKFSV